MRITKWTRKLAAALVAGGLAAPVALAADLQTNLIANPSFENVDTETPGLFTSVTLLDWVDPTPSDPADDEGTILGDAYAYPYSSAYSGDPAPPASGDYHYYGGTNTSVGEVQVSQTVDLSTGAVAAAIGAGGARYDLSGFFSTYFSQSDFASLRVDFQNNSGASLGGGQVGGLGFRDTLPIVGGRTNWGQDRVTGVVPAGATQAIVEIAAEQVSTNHDGYVDLVDLKIGGLPEDAGLQLLVDPSTGQTAIRNLTGDAAAISFYQITSDSGALDPDGWSSFQSQAVGGSDWREAGGASENVLAESLLLDSNPVGAGAVFLGAAYDTSGAQDLVFRYGTAEGLLLFGNVRYASFPEIAGDFNGDLTADAADFTIWRDTLGSQSDLRADADGDKRVDLDDYAIWKNNFGATSAPAALAPAATPEPASLTIFAGVGLLAAAPSRRR